MSVSNIHKTYQIKGRDLITEPLPRYTCGSGQIVDFSTRVESHETEVTAGFVSPNRVRWLSSTDDRRLFLSGNPVDSHDEVDTQIETALGIESAQMETTVAISVTKPIKRRCQFANQRCGSIVDIIGILAHKMRQPTGRFPKLQKAYQPIFTLPNPMVRSISSIKF